MKKRFLVMSIAAISILLAACGSSEIKEASSNDNSGTVENQYFVDGKELTESEYNQYLVDKDNQKQEETKGEIEISITMDNVYDYIDFVSIGAIEELDYNNCWILINKQYENDMIYMYDSLDISFEASCIDANSNEKITGINGICGAIFSSYVDSIDKPIIIECNGTITFYKGGKSYFDSENNVRRGEFGSASSATEIGVRAEYFNEYPY